MLAKFKEEREKRRMVPASGPPGVAGQRSGGEHRSSRGDEHRDRDRGYDRQPSRYESVVCIMAPSFLLLILGLQ